MAEQRIHEVDHELPCGHTLRTSELLHAIERFAPAVSRGYLDGPVCGDTSHLEFAAAAASDGREEFTERTSRRERTRGILERGSRSISAAAFEV